jgi:hypothetical protein
MLFDFNCKLAELGASELKIYGKHYQVKAEIFVIVIAFDFVVVPALFGKE